MIFAVVGLAAMLTAGASLAAAPSAGTVGEKDGTRNGPVQVFVSILPQEYFIERVGGQRVKVQALVKPGASPATYEPSPRQMADLSQAAVFFRIGVPFEDAFLPTIEQTMSGLRIVDTRRGITLRAMKSRQPQESGHGHDHGDHHSTGGRDPHIWLNPRLVKVQAQTMADALIEIDPMGRDEYTKNLENFSRDLDAVDASLTKALAPVKGRTFLVFHPAWGYFADAYGLNQEPIELEGKEPSAKQLARIIDMAKAEDVRVIFVQPQFSQSAVKTIARAIHGLVVPIDPLARDYLKSLRNVAKTVGETLARQK
jgi:zinc transport system substrate-binding protein